MTEALSFGRSLQHAMNERGIGAAELCRRVNVICGGNVLNRAALWRYVTTGQLPSKNVRSAIAAILDIPADALIEEDTLRKLPVERLSDGSVRIQTTILFRNEPDDLLVWRDQVECARTVEFGRLLRLQASMLSISQGELARRVSELTSGSKQSAAMKISRCFRGLSMPRRADDAIALLNAAGMDLKDVPRWLLVRSSFERRLGKGIRFRVDAYCLEEHLLELVKLIRRCDGVVSRGKRK